MEPVPLVLDFRITHEHWGSNSNSSLNDHLYYPTDMDRILNETIVDKVLQYRVDCKNRPSHVMSCMSAIDSTSGWIHCEFVLLLFLQTHRETDRSMDLRSMDLRSMDLKYYYFYFFKFKKSMDLKIRVDP